MLNDVFFFLLWHCITFSAYIHSFVFHIFVVAELDGMMTFETKYTYQKGGIVTEEIKKYNELKLPTNKMFIVTQDTYI